MTTGFETPDSVLQPATTGKNPSSRCGAAHNSYIDRLNRLVEEMESPVTAPHGKTNFDPLLIFAAEHVHFLTRCDWTSVIIKSADSKDWLVKAKCGEFESSLERTCLQEMLNVATSVFESDGAYAPCTQACVTRGKKIYLMWFPLVKTKQALGYVVMAKTEESGDFSDKELAWVTAFSRWCLLRLEEMSSAEIPSKAGRSNPDLLAVMIRSRDEERNRIAGDLHDGVAQWLLNAAYEIDVCRTMLAMGETASLKQALVEAKKTVQQCIQETRRAIGDLKPLQIEKYGLIGALNHKAAQFCALGIKCAVEENTTLPHMSDIQEKTFFWIVEEAMNNARKHAQADTLTVVFENRGGLLQVTVTDDGQGFSLPGADSEPVTKTHGLKGMQTRARLIGAHLFITSRPGAGTEIRLATQVAL